MSEILKTSPTLPSVIANLDAYIAAHRQNGGTLRPRQFDAFRALRDFVAAGGRTGYIKLPAGTGKTVLFVEFTEAITGGTSGRTMIVEPTNVLVYQTHKKTSEFAEGIDVGILNSYSRKEDKQVTITTYPSFMNGARKGTIVDGDHQLIILDEVQEGLSNRRKRIIGEFGKPLVLGFTATPEFSLLKSAEELLGTEIYSMSIREAVAEGLNSPFSVIVAETTVDISNVKIASTGDYDFNDLSKAINIQRLNNAALQLYKQMFTDQKTVAYCTGIDHAVALAAMFNEGGISASSISSLQSRSEQARILQSFKNGEINVLTNADLLTRGFDEPSATVCLNLRPTLSKIMAEQRAGRVLRLNPENPDKHAFIVDFLYPMTRKQILSISFAEVVGEATVMRANVATGLPGSIFDMTAEELGIRIDGLKVTVDSNEVMRLLNLRRSEGLSRAPEGWATAAEIARTVKKDMGWVRQILEQQIKKHPDWIAEYLIGKGRDSFRTHYHPEIGKIVKAEVEQLDPKRRNNGIQDWRYAPKGWATITEIAHRVGRDKEWVIRTEEKLRRGHDGWGRHFVKKGGRFEMWHCCPDLIELIKADAEKTESEKKLQSERISRRQFNNRGHVKSLLMAHAFSEVIEKDGANDRGILIGKRDMDNLDATWLFARDELAALSDQVNSVNIRKLIEAITIGYAGEERETGMFVSKSRLNYTDSMQYLDLNGLRPLTTREILLLQYKYSSLRKRLHNRSIYLAGTGIEGLGVKTWGKHSSDYSFDYEGNLSEKESSRYNRRMTASLRNGENPPMLWTYRMDARQDTERLWLYLRADTSPQEEVNAVAGVRKGYEVDITPEIVVFDTPRGLLVKGIELEDFSNLRRDAVRELQHLGNRLPETTQLIQSELNPY